MAVMLRSYASPKSFFYNKMQQVCSVNCSIESNFSVLHIVLHNVCFKIPLNFYDIFKVTGKTLVYYSRIEVLEISQTMYTDDAHT